MLPTTPTEWDSAQLALGVGEFDVRVQSPHSPGYWFLLALARAVKSLTGLDASQSLSLIAAVATAVASVLAYRVALRLGDRMVALVFTALVVANPFVWFYGLAANAYVFDLIAALALMNIALRRHVTSRHLLIVAATLGIAAGFRQSALYIFGPLVVFIAYQARPSLKLVVGAGAVLAGSIALWLVPASLDQTGGVSVLYEQTQSMWKAAAQDTSLLAGASVEQARANAAKATTTPIVAMLAPVLTALVLLALLTLRQVRRPSPSEASASRIGWVAGLVIVPSVLVTTVGYFGKPGYFLSYLPGILLLVCVPLLRMRQAPRLVSTAALLSVALLGAYQFNVSGSLLPERMVNTRPWFTQTKYGAPFRDYTRDTIEMYDRDTTSYEALPEVATSNDTLVYIGGEGIPRFRHLSYELPGLVHELIQDDPSTPCMLAFEGKLAFCRTETRVVKVAPRGRALFVANAPSAAMQTLADAGIATPLRLSTGPTVFAVPAGVSVGSVPVVTDSNLGAEIRPTYT